MELYIIKISQVIKSFTKYNYLYENENHYHINNYILRPENSQV